MEEETTSDRFESFGEDEEPNQKNAYINLTSWYNNKFKFLPPKFDALFQDSPDMSTLSELMLDLLHTGRMGPLSADSIAKLEIAIRHLIYSMNSKNNSLGENESSISLSLANRAEEAEQKDRSRLRSSLIKVKSEYAALQEESKDQQVQILKLQTEIEDLYDENNNLNKRLTKQRNDFNAEISQQKFNNNVLAENYQDALTKIKLMSGVEEGLRKQLDMAHDESDELAARNKKLSEKIKGLKEKLYTAKYQNKKQQIQIEEFVASKNFVTTQSSPNKSNTLNLSSLSSSSSHSNHQNNNQNNSQYSKSDFIKQKLQLETKSREVEYLKQTIKERESAIDAQKRKIEAQSDLIIQNSNKVDELTQELETLKEQNNQIIEKSLEDQEMQSSRAVELTQTRDILVRISEILSAGYNVQKVADLPDIIDDLFNQQLEQNTNIQAFSIIDGLTRFIDTLLMEDRVDANLLVDQKSILGDRRLLNQITTNINNVKDFIAEKFGDKFEQFKLFDSLLSAKEHFSDDSNNCEFASLTVLCAANDKLRRICINQRKQLNDFISLFPIDKHEDTKKLFAQYDKVCYQLFKEKFDDKFSMLAFFIDSIIAINSRMKGEVQPCLNIDCDFIDLPDNIIDAYQSLADQNSIKNNDLNESLLSSREEIQQTVSAIQQQLEKKEMLNKQLESVTRKLSKEVKQLRSQNLELQEKYEEAKSNVSDMEETYNSNLEKAYDLEEQERAAKLERNRLQALLDHHQQNFQNRVDSLIAAERNNHIEEINRLEKLWNEERQGLQEQIEEKTKKFNKQRKADKELIDFLEAKLKNSHEIMKNADVLQSSQNSNKTSNSSINQNSSIKPNDSSVNEEIMKNIAKELDRVIQISGEWSNQKILSGIKKIVAAILKNRSK
ncbi:hypothetical protein TRFO_41234 [Tritrichomonas foetus]|uniref:Uncharacterized protein n=1 Tax=Tritrichomonas foetus TaxID=1144522 RepID=A0A1J4L190_9EUKA|nr:hypothetical protein TRFO_41234 [Tritrichomonas foetus]|eukprot:OHT17178.1 hypothetical protein TRFO_41234 [Tritrichomonas foetus]